MDVAQAGVSAAQVLYPLAILALGALVKWWMRGTEQSVQRVAASVERVVDQQVVHGRDIAVLQAHRDSDATEIKQLREANHEIRNAMTRIEGKVALLRMRGDE